MEPVSITSWQEFLRQAKIKFNQGGFKKLSDAHKQLAKDLNYRDLFHAQQELQKAAKPRSCYYYCGEKDGEYFIPSIVKENEAGHYPCRGDLDVAPYYRTDTVEGIEKICLQMNGELGLSPEDVSEIVASSMRAQNLAERASSKQLEQAERAASKLYHRYVSEGSVNSAWLVEYHNQLDKIVNAVSEYKEETKKAISDLEAHLPAEVKTYKYILIDPVARTVTEETFESEEATAWKKVKKIIGGWLEPVPNLNWLRSKEHVMLVDEEAGIRSLAQDRGIFMAEGLGQGLIGRAVILKNERRDDGSHFVSATLTPQYVRDHLAWAMVPQQKRKVYVITLEGKIEWIASRRRFAINYVEGQAKELGKDVTDFKIAKRAVTKAELEAIMPEGQTSIWDNAEVM